LSNKVAGVIGGLDSYSGEDLAKIARETYGATDSITPEQLALLMDYLVPSSYIIRNHRIKNGKQRFTFSVPNYGDNIPSKAFSHRPWQKQVVNDISNDLVVIKSRQLGLSEINVAFMLWWVDSHSYAGVNALYTFPTYRQMQDFVKMRLNPILEGVPYFKSIVDPNMNSIDSKKIRNSFLTFRTSSKPGSVEGINADAVFLDRQTCPL